MGWYGSAAPVRQLGLLTYRADPMPIKATRQWATPLENGRVWAAVDLWRLYSETDHRRGDFLTDRKTDDGR